MFIRSERLFLRPAWPEDWRELHALIDDPQVALNLARVPVPYTANDAREFIALERDPFLPNFLVTLPGASGSKIVGCAGLADEGGQAELGYWIGREHWGKGYATEAARAVLQVAGALGHRRVVAGHFSDNPASGRVLRKAGFRPTGQERKRFSTGRGEQVRSIVYAIDLCDSCECDGGNDGTQLPRMAA